MPPTPTEDVEQICLFRWAAYQECKWPELRNMIHIPNGGKRSKAEAARFRAMGVRAGVSDIFLPAARGGAHGLWIELKRVRDGRPSKAQKDWIEDMRKAGYAAEVCKGWAEAADVITRYLQGEG